jgi:hypothetical protein
MKTKLIFLVMLIACYSCDTNNNPVSDAQKEKIKGEVKEVLNTFIKGCDELNFDMAIEPFLDSPDFEYIANGRTYNYQELMAMRPLFDKMINQKLTIADEKYKVLNNSTVLFTTNYKWLQNYKDGHSILEDPASFMFMFKKINNKWRIIYWVDSYVEKNVASESSKELNQVELFKQILGTWKGEYDNKDSTIVLEMKSFGNGALDVNQKGFFKDKIFFEQKFVSGYDKKSDKFIGAMISKDNPEIILFAFWFTSKTTYQRIPFEFISNPEQATSKAIYELTSPDSMDATFINKNKPDKTYKWVRIKK